MLHGLTVTLHIPTVRPAPDPFGAPVATGETTVDVDNVLIGEPTTDEILTSVSMYGRRTQYVLGIPKGDTHDWLGRHVSWTDAHGRTINVRTFGEMITGVTANIPGPWDAKVRAEVYGG